MSPDRGVCDAAGTLKATLAMMVNNIASPTPTTAIARNRATLTALLFRFGL